MRVQYESASGVVSPRFSIYDSPCARLRVAANASPPRPLLASHRRPPPLKADRRYFKFERWTTCLHFITHKSEPRPVSLSKWKVRRGEESRVVIGIESEGGFWSEIEYEKEWESITCGKSKSETVLGPEFKPRTKLELITRLTNVKEE
ncbi:hypothetical protein EVAR_93193_1 [Eumeta japonica]|uniref:Uncharacterized protein n=1 Tax=Eumeta variegata TaxID=151549 RepID=A0A4C1TXJ8_EUMVA|nr:hypothetical protein EVAR_93193_1 [Eumeta japonica]